MEFFIAKGRNGIIRYRFVSFFSRKFFTFLDVRYWTQEHVLTFLKQIQLTDCIKQFEHHAIDGRTFLSLSKEDLTEIGIPKDSQS